jgi:hypothetical protein
MVEEHDLEYWCDMMVKTYNTSILDNFPTSLKRSLQEEATQCVENKPNLNYHRYFLGLKTKKNRNVLMRLINNYVRSKQIESPTIDFIGGPHTLTLHWSAKYNKIIYIFGEFHRNVVCDYDNMMLVENYLKNLFRRTSAFIDFFLEIQMFTKGKYHDSIYTTLGLARLWDLRIQNIKCIESSQRQKNRECDTRRVHFIDIRSIPVDSKNTPVININSTIALQNYLDDFGKYSKRRTAFSNNNLKKSKIKKDKKYIIDTLKNIFTNNYDTQATIDFIRYGSDETYKSFYEKEIETHELVNYELSKSTEGGKIREFAEEEFEKTRNNFVLISIKIGIYLTNCFVDDNLMYDFYKLSDDDYLKFFGYILDYRLQLLNFNSILVDIYTLARMFKKFQLNNSKNTRKTDEPEEPHNIIMYAGDVHSERVRRFLKKLEFDIISESKGDWTLDFCVDIRDFEQPFFSSWPPKKMPQIHTKSKSEEMLSIPLDSTSEEIIPLSLEPTSEKMSTSDFQIQTTSMNEIDEETGLEVLKYEAMLIYKGNDPDFINRTGIQIDMVLSKIDITFYPDQIGSYKYLYDYNYYKTKTYNVYYKGLVQISNSIHSENLIRRFPFLENLKYVDYVMLFLAVQKALESKSISPESNIVIDIRTSSTIKNQSECIRKLVEFYEKIGFRKMFPTHYEDVLERIDNDLHDYIPMIGNVENITESWSNFENPYVLLELIK